MISFPFLLVDSCITLVFIPYCRTDLSVGLHCVLICVIKVHFTINVTGAILKISKKEQKCICLTSAQLRSRFGDEKGVTEKVRYRQLGWLGHVARMPDTRMPKHLLFDALRAVCPACVFLTVCHQWPYMYLRHGIVPLI